MNVENLTMNALFAQLGLDSTDVAVKDFARDHHPLHLTGPLHESTIWNKGQADFLKQAIAQDSNWCVLVDQPPNKLPPDRVPPWLPELEQELSDRHQPISRTMRSNGLHRASNDSNGLGQEIPLCRAKRYVC